MDHARCQCARDTSGERYRNLDCPIHGFNGGDPKVPWKLTASDRIMLRINRITTLESDEIQELRQADEDRFRK